MHLKYVISKQKEDLRKLMLKNNNRRLNYINNSSQINVSPIKDLNKILMPNKCNVIFYFGFNNLFSIVYFKFRFNY